MEVHELEEACRGEEDGEEGEECREEEGIGD